MAGRLAGFPDLTLVELAVADDAVGVAAALLDPVAERDTGGRADALTERASRHIHAGDLPTVGVAREPRPGLVDRLEPVQREIAGLSQRGVKAGRTVALGQHEPVTILPVRAGGVYAHLSAVENSKNVCDGDRAANMSESGATDGADSAFADLRTERFQCVEIGLCHDLSSFLRRSQLG